MAELYDEMMDTLVQYELAMAAFYFAAGEKFPGQKEIWGKLAAEERQHAAIIGRIRKRFYHLVVMADADMAETIKQVARNTWTLDTLRWRLDHDDLAGQELVSAALDLELSVGEFRINQILEAGEHHGELEEYYQLIGEEDGHEKLLLEM